MPGLGRRVVRLAQRAEHQRPQRPAVEAARLDVARHLARGVGGGAAAAGRAQLAPRQRRGGHAELLELGVQQLDAALGRLLVVAEDRRRRPRDHVAGHGLVGGDHALLDQGVGGRLALDADLRHPVALEAHDRLGRVGLERAAVHAPRPQGGGHGGRRADVVVEGGVAERAAGQERVDLGVGQAPLRADQRAGEARLPHPAVAVDDQLDRHRRAVGAGAQAAEVRREPLGQHRHDRAGDVDRVAAPRRLAVQGAPGGHEARDVGDVDPEAGRAAGLGRDRDRVVVVLGALGVDRDDALVAQVAAAGVGGDGRVVGLVGLAQGGPREGPRQSLGRQQPGERRAGRGRRPQHLGHPPRAPAHRDHDQVAHLGGAAGALGQGDPLARLERRLGRRPATRRDQLADQGLGRPAARAGHQDSAAASARPRSSISSFGVPGSSATRTSGGSPRLARSKPLGVR